MVFSSYPRHEISRKWTVGCFSDIVEKKECTVESTEYSNIIDEEYLKWIISFQTGMRPDGTSSSRLLTALVYISTDINTKYEVNVQIQQNDDIPIKMNHSPIWLINRRNRTWRGFLFFLRRSKLIDPKKNTLWEISTIKLFCQIRETGHSLYNNSLYDYAIESPLIRPFNFVRVKGIKEMKPLITSDEYDEYLFDNRYLSDVTFYVDDVLCVGHTPILSRRSRFFKVLFSHEIVRSQPQNFVFSVGDATFEEFYTLLRCIYTKKIENNKVLCPRFMDSTLFRVLSVRGIRTQCSEMLQRLLNFENVYFICTIARRHGLPELTSFVKKFIEDNSDFFRKDLDEASYYLGEDCYAEFGFRALEEEEVEIEKLGKEGACTARCV